MVHAPKDVNVTEHLGKLNIHWGQVQSFSVYNQKIADTVYKCIITSLLPPSWDGFTDPYIAGKFDEISDNPKKMMDSVMTTSPFPLFLISSPFPVMAAAGPEPAVTHLDSYRLVSFHCDSQ